MTTSLPVAPGLYPFSQPPQEEENVLVVQNSSQINLRVGTHWPDYFVKCYPASLNLELIGQIHFTSGDDVAGTHNPRSRENER